MDVTQTTVPGIGVLQDCVTRDGQHFRVLVDKSQQRQVFVYGASDTDAVVTIVLDHDEADHAADLLHSKPIPDRMAELERRLAELAGHLP